LVRVAGVARSSTLSHPQLRVTRYGLSAPVRTLYTMPSVGADVKLGVFDAGIDTLACALLERVYFHKPAGSLPLVPPYVDPRAFAERHYTQTKLFHKYMGKPNRITLQQVVDCYQARKRTIYACALEEYEKYGLLASDSVSNSFVKVEKGDTTKAPRVIQPRKPKYNLVLGQYLKAIEHRVFKALQRMCGCRSPVVMKGYNLDTVASIIADKWSQFKQPVAVGIDASRFDMHVMTAQLMWEHNCYLRMYNMGEVRVLRNPGGGVSRFVYPDNELGSLLEKQMYNRGVGYCKDGKLSYKVTAKRFSGDLNTGMGNCLLMVPMIDRYCREVGVAYDLINNGDDAVVFMEERDVTKFLEGLPQWFIGNGFRMTVERPVRELCEVEFCQMHPLLISGSWTMVRNIPTAVAKDACTVLPITNLKTMQKWHTAIADGGLAAYTGVPILGEFYRMLLRNGKGRSSGILNSVQMQTGMRMLTRGVSRRCDTVTDEARQQVFQAWNITPDEQVALEGEFRKTSVQFSGGEYESSPHWTRLLGGND